MTAAHRGVNRLTTLILFSLWLAACSANTVKGAGEGALLGGAAGAVGGMFTAAIFGGDIGDAAARGAAWGAGTGAVTGAMHGAQQDAAEERRALAEQQSRQQAALAQIKGEIGEDAFAGLAALTEGKHEVALAYARTAARDSNRDYAIAGNWLEALTYEDSHRSSEAADMIPGLVAMDPEVAHESEARQILSELETQLNEIRAEFGLPVRG